VWALHKYRCGRREERVGVGPTQVYAGGHKRAR
jgi:hypothetical protein